MGCGVGVADEGGVEGEGTDMVEVDIDRKPVETEVEEVERRPTLEDESIRQNPVPRRERPLSAASVRAGIWRVSQASPLSLSNPRRLVLIGALCYIRPGDVQRRCPFLAWPSEAR